MAFVLRHKMSGEIAASVQKNVYQLDYYGVKWWASQEEAKAEYPAYLSTHQFMDQEHWELYELDESQIKRLNVKLKNNPQFRVYWLEDGQTVVRSKEEPI